MSHSSLAAKFLSKLHGGLLAYATNRFFFNMWQNITFTIMTHAIKKIQKGGFKNNSYWTKTNSNSLSLPYLYRIIGKIVRLGLN